MALAFPEQRPPRMVDAALAYAAAGIPVFPLRPRDKIPLTDHGFKDASIDEHAIRSWWRRQPRANIGMPTGARSGVIILDIDVKDGKSGFASLAALEATHGSLPVTRTARTGSGGEHRWFSYPDGRQIASKANALPGYPDLDIRNDGGYVVLPPSVYGDGNRYEWLTDSDAPLAPMSDWLITLLEKSEQPPLRQRRAADRPAKSNLISDDPDAAARCWLERFLADAYPGTRNDNGFALACQLRDEGLSEREAEGYMTEYASRVPGDDYTEREALASLKGAYRAAPRERARARICTPIWPKREQEPASEIKFDFAASGDDHELCHRRIAELEAKLAAKDAEVERLKAVIVRMNRHEKERQDIAAAKMDPRTKLVVMDAVNHLDRESGEWADFPLQGGATDRLHMTAGTVKTHLEKAEKAGIFETTVRPTGEDGKECTAIRPGPILLEQRRLREVETAPSRAGGARPGAGRKPGKPGVCGECGSKNVQTNGVTTKTFKVTMAYTTVDQTCRECGTRETVDGGTQEISRELVSETVTDLQEHPEPEEQRPETVIKIAHTYAVSGKPNLITNDEEDDDPDEAPYPPPARACIRCGRAAWTWNSDADRYLCHECPGEREQVQQSVIELVLRQEEVPA